MMEFMLIPLFNGPSYGLLLFMLSSGLKLTFSMTGVLNSISVKIGFWWALIIAPMVVGAIDALVERDGLRSVHKYGHIPELLFTFGLSYVLAEVA